MDTMAYHVTPTFDTYLPRMRVVSAPPHGKSPHRPRLMGTRGFH